MLAVTRGGTPLRRITAKGLRAKAKVNRSTLYAHYGSIYDLCAKTESEFIGEIYEVSMSNAGSHSNSERLENYKKVCEFYRDDRKRLLAFYRQDMSFESFSVKILNMLFTLEETTDADRNFNSEDVRRAKLLTGCSNAGYMHVIFA